MSSFINLDNFSLEEVCELLEIGSILQFDPEFLIVLEKPVYDYLSDVLEFKILRINDLMKLDWCMRYLPCYKLLK